MNIAILEGMQIVRCIVCQSLKQKSHTASQHLDYVTHKRAQYLQNWLSHTAIWQSFHWASGMVLIPKVNLLKMHIQ